MIKSFCNFYFIIIFFCMFFGWYNNAWNIARLYAVFAVRVFSFSFT